MPPDALILAQNAPKCVWRPGSARTRWGSLSAPPDPLAAKRGPTSKGRREGGEGTRGEGTEGRGPTSKGRGKEGRGGEREGGKKEGVEGRGAHAIFCPGAPGFLVTPLSVTCVFCHHLLCLYLFV